MSNRKPIGVQRKRTKGWRLPPNTVCVTRPGKWGNPFRVQRTQLDDGKWYWEVEDTTGESEINMAFETRAEAVELSLVLFREWAKDRDYGALRNKNLACYCKLGEPCHRDFLLEIANK